MIEAIKYQNMLDDLQRKYKNTNKTFAIILSKPNKTNVSEEILNNISYFHHRSSNKLDIYLPGYGAYLPNDYYPDAKNICNLNGVPWSFSSKYFTEFIDKIEQESTWKYRGGSELILLDFEQNKISYNNVVRIKLNKALKDGAIDSVEEFIEKIIGIFIKSSSDSNYAISDKLTLNELGKSIAEELSSKFSILRIFKRSKHYTIYNYEKK